jgi:outer membrane murein-binding lipoprotein Lpp
MAGIELNPGPTTAELATLITNLFTQVATGFAQVAQCNNKLDAIITDMVDLKAKCATLEVTVARLCDDRDALQHDRARLSHEIDVLKEENLIAQIASRDCNLVISGLELPKSSPHDPLSRFLVNQLKFTADDATQLLNDSLIRVIRDRNTPNKKATAIIGLRSVQLRNNILSHSKELKGTSYSIFRDLPKPVQEARKALNPYYYAARSAGNSASFIGTRLRIDNTHFAVSDILVLAVRYPHASPRRLLN